MTDVKARLVSRTLYRSLLRASKPFTERSSKGALLCSLLYRSGEDDITDSDDHRFIQTDENNEHSNTSKGALLYKSFVSDIVGEGKHMNFPSQILSSMQSRDHSVMDRLRDIIRREFRDTIIDDEHSETRKLLSHGYSHLERRNAAFLGLRQLNRKYEFAHRLGLLQNHTFFRKTTDQSIQVTNRIRPGTFLVAHPLLEGYFARTVVVILEHSDAAKTLDGGTYGLVINRPSYMYEPTSLNYPSPNKRRRTLSETIRSDSLPRLVQKAFGKCPILEGGPLNFSVQMLRLDQSIVDHEKESIPDRQVLRFGDDDTHVEKVYFGGDIMKESKTVLEEMSNLDDYIFIIGASCWETGQLEREIQQGYWLLGESPSGLWEPLRRVMSKDDEEDDIWESFMLSKEDAELASVLSEDSEDENGLACDLL